MDYEIVDYDPDDIDVQAATGGHTCRHPDGDERDGSIVSGQYPDAD